MLARTMGTTRTPREPDVRAVTPNRLRCNSRLSIKRDAAPKTLPVGRLAPIWGVALLFTSSAGAQVYSQPNIPVSPQAAAAPTLSGAGATTPIAASFTLLETLTNNVNLAPSAARQGDLVTQLTPTLLLNERSAHTSLYGSVSVPILLYARTGAENNQVYAQANVAGSLEALEKHFFIDGSASVSQQYLTPFGAAPIGLTNATQNRYTSETYSVTPHFGGASAGGITYELRDANTWTNLSNAPAGVNNAYTNDLTGRLVRDPAPWGWFAYYDATRVKFTDQGPLDTQLARLALTYQVDPQLQTAVDGGYENNRYPLTSYRGPIYGVGGKWRPTERTHVEGAWEHRFFGSSYLFNFDHRMPLSVWSVNASRNITSYPQQLATLPAGGTVALLLDQLLSGTIPDPGQRQSYINQLIQNQGLPTLASAPITIYTEQISLQENASATVGLIGARNSVFLTGYYLRSQPITAAGTPLPGFLAQNNNTQTGGDISWTHKVTPFTSLTAGVNYLRTVANEPLTGTSKQGWARAVLTTNLSRETNLYAGARYQVFRSDVSSDYSEAAVFVGFSYSYH